jgi:polyferredoxin
MKKLSQADIQPYRKIIQHLFLATVLLIGVQFMFFVKQLEDGAPATVARPPAIEAFLPISALISLKYWLVTGIFNSIHPSGLIILLMILTTAILLKRGFCSWVCPFGLLTEYLNRLHRFVLRKPIQLSRRLDYPLRCLKYLLLAFFLWAILIKMDASALEFFIYSPYNMVADIKMLRFFVHISTFALWVLVILVVLSILVRNCWCRYLCPYGALLGMLSFLSLFKIHRNDATCTQCRQCTRTCPVDIPVHQAACVLSDECHACLKCVSVCPEANTLHLSASKRTGILKPWMVAAGICFIFSGGSLAGRMSGYWQTGISTNEYRFHVRHLSLPMYQHHRGQVPVYNKEAWLEMMAKLRETGDAVQGDPK